MNIRDFNYRPLRGLSCSIKLNSYAEHIRDNFAHTDIRQTYELEVGTPSFLGFARARSRVKRERGLADTATTPLECILTYAVRGAVLSHMHVGRSFDVREPTATTKGMGHSTRCGEWRARWQLHRQINHEVNTLLKLATAGAARDGRSRMILVAG